MIASVELPLNAVLSPLFIIVLCAIAAIGTVMLLPAGREGATRKIGGAIALSAGVIAAATLIRLAAGRDDPMGIYFWVFSAIGLFGALRVVTHRRPIYSAIYFVLTVFASAGLFVLLWAEFMAAALIVIYAGAILVTYVFVIMLAARPGAGGELSEQDTHSREPVAAAAVGFGLMAMLLYVIFDRAPAAVGATALPTGGDLGVRRLALYLFEHQLVNFELAGLLLTMATVGAIVIAHRRVWSLETPKKPIVDAFGTGDDNPHSVQVEGASDPRQKAYPEA